MPPGVGSQARHLGQCLGQSIALHRSSYALNVRTRMRHIVHRRWPLSIVQTWALGISRGATAGGGGGAEGGAPGSQESKAEAASDGGERLFTGLVNALLR
eukprot:9360769-Pyramimonas_sp.AAC.1